VRTAQHWSGRLNKIASIISCLVTVYPHLLVFVLHSCSPLPRSQRAESPNLSLSFTSFSVTVTVSFNGSGSFLMNRQLRYRCRAFEPWTKKKPIMLWNRPRKNPVPRNGKADCTTALVPCRVTGPLQSAKNLKTWFGVELELGL